MSKPVWKSGPPPSLGWWPVSGPGDGYRWWDGKAWSIRAVRKDPIHDVKIFARCRTSNTGITWRDRPKSWPARSRT